MRISYHVLFVLIIVPLLVTISSSTFCKQRDSESGTIYYRPKENAVTEKSDSFRNLAVIEGNKGGKIEGVIEVPEKNLIIHWVGEGSKTGPSERTGGFKYCRTGKLYNINETTNAFDAGDSFAFKAHYEWLYSSRWCGYAYYKPYDTLYDMSIHEFQIPSPWSQGYLYWKSFNVVFYYSPMDAGMQSCEGIWKAEWYDNSSVVCTKYYTVMYKIFGESLSRNINSNNDPENLTNEFYTNDDSCYYWMRLLNYAHNVNDDIKWMWYDPDNNLYGEYIYDIENPGSGFWEEVKVYCGIPINESYAALHPGNWHVETYVKDYQNQYELKRIRFFTIEDNPRPCEISQLNFLFGSVETFESLSKTFTIENRATETLYGTITMNCNDFSLIPDSTYLLQAGQSKTFSIIFSPQSVGLKECWIETGNALCSDLYCQGVGYAAEVPDNFQFGDIVIDADVISKIGINKYQLSGNANINDFLKFSGDIIIDLNAADPFVAGSCAVYVNTDVPVWEEVTFYEGEFEFHVFGTNLIDFLDLGEYTEFKIGDFSIALTELQILSDGVVVGGNMELPEEIGGGVYINSLKFAQNNVTIDAEIQIPDIDIKAVTLTGMFIAINTEDNTFEAGLSVETPLVIIGGALEIVDGKLDAVSLSVESGEGNPGVAIDATGLFLTGGGGYLYNISNPHPIVIGVYVNIGGGPSIGGISLVSLNEVGVEIKIPVYFKGMGKVMLLEEYEIAGAELLYQNKSLSLDGYVNIADILTGDINSELSSSNFSGSLEGSLHIPGDLPWWLSWAEDYEVGYVSADVNTERLRGKASIKVPTLWGEKKYSLAYRLRFVQDSPYFKFDLGTNYSNLTNVIKRYVGISMSATYLIPERTERVMFFKRQIPGGQVPDTFYLINPNGDTLGPADIPYLEYPEEDTAYAFYLLDDPITGQWDVYIPDTTSGYDIVVKSPNHIPSLQIIKPAVPNDENIIEWEAEDFDDNADIIFYFDDDNIGFDGLPINVNPIKEDSRLGSLEWDNSDIDPGEYYIYGIIQDSVNGAVRLYSTGTIVVEEIDLPLAPSDFRGEVHDSLVLLEWTLLPDYDDYVIFYCDTFKNVDGPDIASISGDNQCVLYDLTVGHTYWFCIAAMDDSGKVGEISDTLVFDIISSVKNNTPTITSIYPPITAQVGSFYGYSLSAFDPDNDPINFTLLDGPMGMQLESGHIEWTPDSAGVRYIKIQATDPDGAADSLGYILHIYNPDYLEPGLYFNSNIYRGFIQGGYVTLAHYSDSYSMSEIDTVSVTLISKAEPEGLQVRCVESSAASYIFTTRFAFTPGNSQPDNNVFHVESGDSLRVELYDGDQIIAADSSLWFAFPENCDIFDAIVLPDEWPGLWLNPDANDADETPYVTFILSDLEGSNRSVTEIDFRSVRLNNIIAPSLEHSQLPDTSLETSQIVLAFDGNLAIYSIGEQNINNNYTNYISGQFKDGVSFCAECDISIIPTHTESSAKSEILRPKNFSLSQNHPNPFNGTTSIMFSLSKAIDVKLEIFNIAGQKVATVVERHYEAGNHIVRWDAGDCASGVYFYRLEAGDVVETRKMTLLK